MWNSSRVVRVCSMEFLLVVRVWIASWLKTIAWIAVVAAGKGAKRMLMCPRSSGSVRRERSACLAGERGSVISWLRISRSVSFSYRRSRASGCEQGVTLAPMSSWQ